MAVIGAVNSLREPLRKSSWRWESGLGAPAREGTPKHATGTWACPSLLRATACRFRGADVAKEFGPGAVAITLVLEQRNGDWKIVHTHASDLGPPTN